MQIPTPPPGPPDAPPPTGDLTRERVRRNRTAWDIAARKYVDESEDLLAQASEGQPALAPAERELLEPLLAAAPGVVHLQSGNGLDDLDLARAGARWVVGVDFSATGVAAAQHRAVQLGLAVRYVVADALRTGLRAGCADLVHTGKGALMWLPDIGAWGREVARLLRPGGHLVVHEAHPAACLWVRGTDPVRLDERHGYLGGTRVNDTFPASAIARFGGGKRSPASATTPKAADRRGPSRLAQETPRADQVPLPITASDGGEGDDGLDAVEWQWTLADVVTAVLDAGLELRHLAEHPEPFWRPAGGGRRSPSWAGHLPELLLAPRPPAATLEVMSVPGVSYDGRMAAVYDAGRQLLPEAEDGWATTVRERVPVGGRVVDVGAGTGRFARLFAERFAARVAAVEPAAGMRSAGTRHRAANVRWVAGRAERLPLARGTADVAWLSCVAHYLDLDAAGGELARVVRDGGRVLVRSTFPDRFDDLEWMRWFPAARAIDEVRMPSVERLQEAWAPHGLTLEARLPNSQVIAHDLHALVDRLEHRAISTLELISDADFAAGLAALRAHAERVPPRPSYSAMDILSFTRP